MAVELYGPVGHCIYCGASPPPRLGGEHILLESSCIACGDVTGRFEQLVLRGGLRGIKERLGFASRTKGRPKALPLFIGEGAGTRFDVPVEDYPATVVLPHIVGPTLAPFPGAATSQKIPWGYIPPTDIGKLATTYGLTQFSPSSIDTFAFARMLAKIAHSFAVAQLGSESFVPFLPTFILSNDNCDFRLFMGTMELRPQLPAEIPTDGNHLGLLADEDAGGQEYITAIIQLFRSFDAPFYRVVIGQRISQFSGAIPACEPAPDELKGYGFQRIQFTISERTGSGF
jgi:hypothetical protein